MSSSSISVSVSVSDRYGLPVSLNSPVVSTV